MQQHVERFLKSKTIEGCTPKTLKAYRYELQRYFEFLKARTGKNPELSCLTKESVEDWLSERPLDNPTRARMLSAIKSFSRFLRDREILTPNPLDALRTPRIKAKAISFLTGDEYRKLLQDAKEPFDQARLARNIPGRDFAILALFMGSGIRISELAGLSLADVDLKAKQIKVTRKGGKGQYVPIGEPVAQALRVWLEARSEMHLAAENKAFFVSNQKRRMSLQSIRNVVRKWMTQSGLWGKKMSPHTLRHSYATAQIAAGTPVQVVQELLGHNQLNTTSKYLHLVDQELKKAAEKIRF